MELNVFSQLQLLVQRLRPDDTCVIAPASRLIQDLGLTSFEMMVLLCDIEETFNLTMEVDDMPKAVTLADLTSRLEKALNIVNG